MSTKRSANDLSVQELEQLLYRKIKKAVHPPVQAFERRRPRGGGDRLSSQDTGSSFHVKPGATAFEKTQDLAFWVVNDETESDATADEDYSAYSQARWRQIATRTLLLIEFAVVVGLIAIGISLYRTLAELNQELVQVLRAESQSLALPTPPTTAVIDVVVLPSGPMPSIASCIPEPGEADDIPEYLLPVVNTYQQRQCPRLLKSRPAGFRCLLTFSSV